MEYSSLCYIMGPCWLFIIYIVVCIFLPFHTVHGVLQARILKWFAIPFSSGPHSVRLSTMTCPSWVAPWAWLSFIELDKAVEVRNTFKGLDLIDRLMNYGMRFVTLYRRQGSGPSPWKRNAKKQNGCLGRPHK